MGIYPAKCQWWNMAQGRFYKETQQEAMIAKRKGKIAQLSRYFPFEAP